MAHSDKIALQVAEGMLHASNLSLATLRKVEGRSTFLATRNATIAVAKWGVTREFFLQVARKIASCNMALRYDKFKITRTLTIFVEHGVMAHIP